MPNPQPIPVNARPEDMQGRYANAVSVTSQEREVVLDFMSHVNVGGQPQAALVSRLFLNHFTARELVELIQKTLGEWEKKRYELPENK